MAKKYVIYAGSKDLAECPVTQNEVGKYYRNSAGVYYKPTLAEFDTAKPPAGFKTYIGGSHAKHINNPQRNPIDFSLVAGTVVSMNADVNVIAFNKVEDWVQVRPVGTDYIIVFVHTYEFAKGLVKAGKPICKIAPKSVTGFDPHLHIDDWSGKGRRIRQLILNGDYEMSKFKKGDKVIITATQNIRKAPAGQITGDSVIGQTGVIYDNPREAVLDGVNYTWYDIHIDGGGSGWFADIGKFKLYTEPVPEPVPVPTPEPVDPCKELKDRTVVLETENKELNEALRTSQEKIKTAEKKVVLLEDDKKIYEERIKEAEEKAQRFENQYLEAVKQLNELKNSQDKQLIKKILELWDKFLKLIKVK